MTLPLKRTAPDWHAAVQRTRDASSWITKFFAAAAAILIGSGPLVVSLGGLTWGPRAIAVVLGGAAALLGIGLVIRSATQVMLPEATDLVDLVTAESGPLRALRERVESPIGQRVYLGSDADSVAALIGAIERWQRSVEQLAQFDQQVKAYESQVPKPAESTLPVDLRTAAARSLIPTAFAAAQAQLRLLTSRALELVKQGVYVEVQATFQKARRVMLMGGALAALGVSVYAAALGAGPGKQDESDAPKPVTVQTLTWRTDQAESGRPVADVRGALGLQRAECDTLLVVVQDGMGSRTDPWKVTTVGGDRQCPVSSRTFQIDDRYVDLIAEPATEYSLDKPQDSPQLSTAIMVGVIAGLVILAAGLAFIYASKR